MSHRIRCPNNWDIEHIDNMLDWFRAGWRAGQNMLIMDDKAKVFYFNEWLE